MTEFLEQPPKITPEDLRATARCVYEVDPKTAADLRAKADRMEAGDD